MPLCDTSLITLTPDQVSCDLEGELVILSLASGSYYGLSRTAAAVWRLLDKPILFGQLVDEVQQAYNIATGQCRVDLEQFLAQLAAEGLVVVADGTPAPSF